MDKAMISQLLIALFSTPALKLRLFSDTMSGIDILVVVEKEVLDGMAELRSAVSRLPQHIHDVHGEYGYIPLPGRLKSLAELLDSRMVPYHLSTPSAM